MYTVEKFCETDEDCRGPGNNQYFVYKCIDQVCQYVRR